MSQPSTGLGTGSLAHEAFTRDNFTLLHLIARYSHTGTMGLLLGKGASIDQDNNTLLHCAAEGGFTETVKLLLEKGAPVEAVNKGNNTPLHLAAKGGHAGVVAVLLEKGAYIEAMQGEYNLTPLQLAAWWGHTGTVGLLLGKGAFFFFFFCFIARRLTTWRGGKGASIEGTAKDNWTSPHLAAVYGHASIVKLGYDGGDIGDGSGGDGGSENVPHKVIFASHISKLYPLLERKLVDRFAQQQVKRFKKLEDCQAKHLASLRMGGCPNKNKCSTFNSLLTAPSITSGEVSGKDGIEEHLDPTSLGAHCPYPFGIPDPPVTHLPAEFECTICFKVKKFHKPSDWKKHVLEDVQPFTCTFPECPEPKSYKREADWVRHESERHRNLEWWKCNQPDCQHVSYRKEFFVQHLVREHRFQEPKIKAMRAVMKARVGAAGVKGKKEFCTVGGNLLATVELCHNDTAKRPSSEECRFCGTTLPTWVELTVHLAWHMEHISLPILDLLKNDSKIMVPTSGPSTHTVAAVENGERIKRIKLS